MQTQEKRIIWAELAEERVRGVGRGDLTDGQWQRLEPLLMAHRARTGRPAKDHRTVINGILWVLRTGAPWRDLPEIYGPLAYGSQQVLSLEEAGVVGPVLGCGAAGG